MPSWLIGALIALALGLSATFYLWVLRRRVDETSAGLLALAALRWRDFSRLVLSSLQLRGLDRLSFEPEDIRNQHPSFLLGDKEGKHWLLSCKHGTAYRIGSVAIDELASEARLRGAQRAILATEGMVDAGGREKAERSSVEVLDGSKLWHEVKPMLDSAIVQRIVSHANGRARRHIGLSWIAALLIGVLAASFFSVEDIAPSTAATDAPAPAAAPVAPPASTAPATPAAPTAPATDQELAQQRSAVTKALAKAGGLRQPAWISSSTLSVDMLANEAMVMTTVCAELAKHPELTLSRIQLNPAPGSNERVRWRQCEAAPAPAPVKKTH
ncbi:Restriction endonuclease [Pseudoxanthomonas sp. GM95]|uniref:restriction endonuclease n=1 Tax=Pseudoxanthomonas sp. GM95 TaxID=1881043 RepID=UPI0008B6BD8F|nr:restriction endonuclease [Pseudoxanthomonas sp. GM95]SEK95147.1 Restriction endonuclease [Pseudoxanthomonas sp. GM95]